MARRQAHQACGTDGASQQRYRDSLTAVGLDVSEAVVDYTAELTIDQIVGGVYSALPADRLPAPGERRGVGEQIVRALAPHAPFAEHVRVTMLTGRTG